jgi:predicted 3-demethylubiquinone-9 3-methyltransferase (glyoxalase superfamily)
MINAQWAMSKSISNLDDFKKSLLKRHPGEGRGQKSWKILDSGFRRNDEFFLILTSYEIFKFNGKP